MGTNKKPRNLIDRRGFLRAGAASLVATALGKNQSLAQAQGTNPLEAIVSVRIYPGIGVARIGNSREADGYFIGPEVVDPPLVRSGETRDFSGAIKRQAARFRIYGYNSQGQVVRELTSETANIQWSVHLANKKASWYRFTTPLDLPESSGLLLPRRNPTVTDRESLVINPGLQTIEGRNQNPVLLNQGKFLTTPVNLGELRTDELGRLLVLGGHGSSASPENTTIYNDKDEDSFNNADGWYDDISDGPVRAKVTLAGRTFEAEPSWVIVAPPNYAPNTIGWRTLYDLMVDVYVEKGWLPPPSETSFAKDVLPILQRLSNLQWVNNGFALEFGAGCKWNFADPELIAKISDPAMNGDLRKSILNSFRWVDHNFDATIVINPDDPAYKRLWPMQYGDTYGSDLKNSVNINLVLDGVRLIHLKNWASGRFIADWQQAPVKKNKLSDYQLSEQPDMLNKAALHFCLADAFHPGCEVTWPMRHSSLYRDPAGDGPAFLFRIKQMATESTLAVDLGENLTQSVCMSNSGALQAQGPGDLTKWMALPWQGDTAFCRSGYDPKFDPYLLTFWPARVPNQVLAKEDYEILVDRAKSVEERKQAFARRQDWTRSLCGEADTQMLAMTTGFGDMGIVEALPLPSDPKLANLPSVVMVETFAAGAAKPTARNIQQLLGHFAEIQYCRVVNATENLTETMQQDLQSAWQNLSARHPTRAAELQQLVNHFLQAGLKSEDVIKAGWSNVEQLIEFRLIKMRKNK